jgi:hypothetical protein
LFSPMTHRTDRQDAVVPGQITVPEGTETTQVRTLLGEMDIAGTLARGRPAESNSVASTLGCNSAPRGPDVSAPG